MGPATPVVPHNYEGVKNLLEFFRNCAVRSPAGYAGDLAMTTQPFSELETVGCLIIAMNARTDIKFCHFTPPGISMP